jgi:hypothetical protein
MLSDKVVKLVYKIAKEVELPADVVFQLMQVYAKSDSAANPDLEDFVRVLKETKKTLNSFGVSF